MSKPSEMNEIYENLPCQTKIKNNESINQNSSTKKPNLSKEMLYATPMRKSDRYKKDNSPGKINNTDYKQTKTIESTFLDGAIGGTNGRDLEESRIINFLKDTSQLHKKMELQKDFPNSNFSFLAKEEHFANLVQQNVILDDSLLESFDSQQDVTAELVAGEETTTCTLEELEAKCNENLELLTNLNLKKSPEKICNKFDDMVTGQSLIIVDPMKITINREWVLKKIAMCLEQRTCKKPIPMPPGGVGEIETASGSRQQQQQIQILPQLGCLVLGSNGSGKTSICRNILEGTTGTRGILNRRLLGCFFINSQNPDCHSLSMFIRTMVLQILSHSSFIDGTGDDSLNDLIVPVDENVTKNDFLKFSSENFKTSTGKKPVSRQQSEPIKKLEDLQENCFNYSTHPPLIQKTTTTTTTTEVLKKEEDSKGSPSKKISKIPVKIGSKITIKPGCSTDIEIEKEVVVVVVEKKEEEEEISIKEEPITTPPPLPKTKSCRVLIADGYYEMLVQNPEIFESLNVDNIEKNPDECFKKAILFPLLELNPPKSALLLVIDSIDENYINEGTLITTLGKTGRNSTKSRNIAELLSNHIHLFPKWLFMVSTAKKQNKNVTRMFTGFKKITLDDLRKSHVVKDVQEYIINRLNTDFKGMFNLTKEVIENLNQLYIKSNGCILYLQKVLNGIKVNFFTFREIKLIPCTLNGLYLYICQKSFNKKQYNKIRPILNVLLACSDYAEKSFIHNCLRMHNYTIDNEEFERRIQFMKNILIFDGLKMKIFHNSFCDWLVDVKFSTKKFLCDVNDGHIMISMYYTLISDTLCPNKVRRYIYHLIKSGEYLNSKQIHLDLILILIESKTNLSDCFYTNQLNCCRVCENDCKNDINFLPKTKEMIEKFLYSELNQEFTSFLCDFFKPNLPTDSKTLKLLIESGINNAESQLSCESSIQSPDLSEKSQNIDSELAELLISSERSCHQEQQLNNSLNERNYQNSKHVESHTEVTASQLMSDAGESQKGKALVHILANEGNHILLERALRACKDPIDLEIEDLNGQTALNIAARNGHIEIVKLLLNYTKKSNENENKKCIDVNHADRDGWTPLRSASWGGHTEVVKLLKSHPDSAIDFADKEGRTALRAAAWSGHEDILKILIDAGANVNSVDKQGRTSLIAASYMGHYDIVEILLDSGADVNHLDLDGRSALCVAALCGSSGYNKVISTLLEHGANTDQLDNDGMSPLLVSSFEGNSDICELLLENGADPDLADYMGRSSLWAACTAGHANVVKLLLFWGCGIDCMDTEGRTVLSIAAAQGNLETVRQLLDRGLDETHRDNAGWTPLHYAAFEGYSDICVQLLESGAKIDECDNEGKTALHLAAQEGHNGAMEAILDIHNACVDIRAHDGKTSFRLACLEGHFECIQTLLKYGCDVNSKDADSRTTLYILALENKLKVVKFLIEFANIDVNIPDAEGRTALHVSSWQGHAEMVKLLITMGNADVNSMDLECRSPLHSCAWQGNHQVMDILLCYGAVGDHACKQGATALGISAQEGHEECVKVLLQFGANPFKSDHCGRTPFKLAAKSNRNNVMKILENFAKNETNLETKQIHPNHSSLKSPDKPFEKQILLPNSHSPIQNPNLLMPNNTNAILNATSSTQSSNFYENTMHSDTSSLQKRKSVISSQSTESSNEAPISFTQQLQKQSRHPNRNSQILNNLPIVNSKQNAGGKNSQRHSQVLPHVNEYQSNMASNIPPNEADLFDCLSPLYASPPHSPISDISSPGQHPLTHFNEIGAANNLSSSATHQIILSTDNHFARDTHMRIILGNSKDNNLSSSKSKRSGIATNPAVRMIRSRFDSAAQVIRRANNILTSSSSNQGSSSIGVKSGTFQWRKESQM